MAAPQAGARQAALVILASAMMAGCATAPKTARSAPNPMAEPLVDLGIVREAVPSAVARAAEGPYSRLPDCAAIAAELAGLDAELGPDVDAPALKPGEAAKFFDDMVSGALGLPYRGIIRRLTGADKRQQLLEASTLAAMVRRGFLKGLALGQHCAPPPAA